MREIVQQLSVHLNLPLPSFEANLIHRCIDIRMKKLKLLNMDTYGQLINQQNNETVLLLSEIIKQREIEFKILKEQHAELHKKMNKSHGLVINEKGKLSERSACQNHGVSLEMQEKLKTQEGFLCGINKASTCLLTEKNYEKAIIQALKAILQASQADRIYIYKNSTDPDGELCVSHRFEVLGDNISHQINNPYMQNIRYEEVGFGEWGKKLSNGKIIKAFVDELSPEMQSLLVPYGNLAMLIVPILIQGKNWGFLGFDNCTDRRSWSQNEVELLISTANTIGTFIARHEAEQCEQLEYEVSRMLAQAVEVDTVVKQVLEKICVSLQWQVGELWRPSELGGKLVRAYGFHLPDDPEAEGFFLNTDGLRYDCEEAILGLAWSNQKHVYISNIDPQNKCKRIKYAVEAGFQTAIAAPIIVDNESFGILFFLNRRPQDLLDIYIRTLSSIGAQVGQFIKRKKVESLYKDLVDAVPTVVWRLDIESACFTYVSQKAKDLLGYPVKDWIGNSGFWLEHIHPDDQKKAISFCSLITQNKEDHECEYRMIHKDGREVWVYSNVHIVMKDDKAVELVGVFLDITELKSSQEKIQQLNKDLEARVEARTTELKISNQDLESFAYSISHDLRAPLRHINGYSRLLVQRSAQLEKSTREFVGFIAEAAVKMGQQVDDLLQYSRIGRGAIKSEPINITALVQTQVETILQEHPNRKFKFKVGELPVVYGDSLLIEQVFENLLSNAVKYTNKEKVAEIEIGAKFEKEMITYHVRDNGVGFDEAYKHKLFKVFQRLHGESEFEGTGIGLANVYRIVQRHQGKVWGESKLGEGATFFVQLPNSS